MRPLVDLISELWCSHQFGGRRRAGEAMNCRSCGAAILFVTMQKTGKSMPLDAEPSDRGNILLSNGQGVVVKNPDDARACGEKTYLSHFASCPNSQRHRKV